ncbi:hypothetical protein [Methylosinus sp. PW1]|uniref:hypothetical protein n=1 Tax=Methylosinus sp. PW1 TaxID=107636 RepID=UPI001AEBE4AC|nr:hypothetical protein [Methylosinus sp. PW1]
MFARSGAGFGRYDGLRSFRGEEGRRVGDAAPRGVEATSSYEAEAEAINALFAAKLAGLRRRLPRWEIPAAVRAIKERHQAALAAMRERRHNERVSARDERRERAGYPPAARPA